MRLEIADLPEESEIVLYEEAALQGVEFDEWLRRLLLKEAKRLFYVHRSMRKKPPKDQVDRALASLTKNLRDVYAKKREFFGEDFERLFGEQERKLEAAIATRDGATLARMWKEQPWNERVR